MCEHSSWPHAWPNKVHTLHAHAAISCIVAHQKLYHSDLYLLYSSHICMFTLMSIVHEVIDIATLNLTEHVSKAHSHTSKRWDYSDLYSLISSYISFWLIAINLYFFDSVVCEHSSWPHAWPNKVHTLHAHAAISCIVAYQKLYHSDLYLLYSSHICMFILMSIVHEVINIATLNLTETCI